MNAIGMAPDRADSIMVPELEHEHRFESSLTRLKYLSTASINIHITDVGYLGGQK